MPKSTENKDIDATTPIDTLDDLIDQNKLEEEKKEVSTSSKKKKKNKKNRLGKLKKWWNKLSKPKKILLIISLILILALIVVGIVFTVRHFLKNEPEEPIEEEPEVIVELENYRYENGTLVFLDENKEEIGRYDCKNKDENLCYISYYSTEDSFDTLKKQYEDGTPIPERIPIIQNNYVFINDGKEKENTIYLYDIANKNAAEEIYQLVKKGTNENNFIVKNDQSQYGVLTINDMITVSIAFDYDYLGYTENEGHYYISKQQNRNVLIDENGKNVSKTIPGEITNIQKNYVKSKDSLGKYAAYDLNGNMLFSDCTYLEIYDEYAAIVKDNKLYLQFYDQTKLHEEDMVLVNTDFVTTNIYDENKKLIKTLKSFALEENDSIITISIFDSEGKIINTITLNKLEALLNKNLKYLNYFDGKIYFYRDSEKKNLLGTYTCNNRNEVTKDTISLTNCSIAKDTLFEKNEIETLLVSGFIPIFNERFVFLNDNPTLKNDANQTVVLYDLKAKKTISKYGAVNTYSHTGLEEVSFQNATDLQVVARNKSNAYGVIKIGGDVTAHIPFQYQAIEKIGDYYEAKNDSGTILINRNTKEDSDFASVPGPIMNYNENYVTVLENNQYYVYNHRGEKLNQTGYQYIGLYDKFFTAVKDHKLMVYAYENPRENLLNIEVNLLLERYYGEGTMAYKITSSNNSYQVQIGKSDNTYEPVATFTIPTGEDRDEE